MGEGNDEYLTKEDLEELLVYKQGPSVEVESFSVKPLTKPGENYGSNILAVDVILKGDRKKLHLVVKLVPVLEFLRKVFQCDITVRKEMDMYLLVRPEYERIQKENNIADGEFLDVFPVCYGARATKDEDVGQPADEGAAIILENLKSHGYVLGNRTIGFDFAHTKYVLKHLARFHATAIAIKIKKPEVFEKTIKKACTPTRPESETQEFDTEKYHQSDLRLLEKIPGCEHYVNRVAEIFKQNPFGDISKEAPSEPFASINHNDFWVNNMMINYGLSTVKKIPVGFKIVDFQTTRYDSPVKDLLFFLYTSTEVGLLDYHYDEFIKFYHQTFVDWLIDLNCDITSFSLNKFMSEIDSVAPSILTHILFMLKPIHLKEKKATDLENFTEESWVSDNIDSYADVYPAKVKMFLDHFNQRGWMQTSK